MSSNREVVSGSSRPASSSNRSFATISRRPAASFNKVAVSTPEPSASRNSRDSFQSTQPAGDGSTNTLQPVQRSTAIDTSDFPLANLASVGLQGLPSPVIRSTPLEAGPSFASNHQFTLTPDTTSPPSPLNAHGYHNECQEHGGHRGHDEYGELSEHDNHNYHHEHRKLHECASPHDHREHDNHHKRLDRQPDSSFDRFQCTKRRKLPDGSVIVIDSDQSSQPVILPTNEDITEGYLHEFLADDYDYAPSAGDKGKHRALDPAFDSEMPDPYTPSVGPDIVDPVSRPAINARTRSKSVTLDTDDIEKCDVPDASYVNFIDDMGLDGTNYMDKVGSDVDDVGSDMDEPISPPPVQASRKDRAEPSVSQWAGSTTLAGRLAAFPKIQRYIYTSRKNGPTREHTPGVEMKFQRSTQVMTIRVGGKFLMQYSGENAPVKTHMPGVMEFIIDLPKTNYRNRPLEYQDLLYEVSCASKNSGK
ncbi:hypothetical protein G6514_006658 [Epicoccum nigrum]|nr:hypothetical protein G6514_006658 [Epicoccum nigrum]